MGFFASRSVAEHLVRGLLGALLVAAAIWLFSVPNLVRVLAAMALILGAAVSWRGCPTCWTMGLMETIARSKQR